MHITYQFTKIDGSLVYISQKQKDILSDFFTLYYNPENVQVDRQMDGKSNSFRVSKNPVIRRNYQFKVTHLFVANSLQYLILTN